MTDGNADHDHVKPAPPHDAAGAPEPVSAVEAARRYGVDIEALKANLARSVEERIRRHEIALDLFRALFNKGRS
jgi:hypothetical protein